MGGEGLQDVFEAARVVSSDYFYVLEIVDAEIFLKMKRREGCRQTVSKHMRILLLICIRFGNIRDLLDVKLTISKFSQLNVHSIQKRL